MRLFTSRPRLTQPAPGMPVRPNPQLTPGVAAFKLSRRHVPLGVKLKIYREYGIAFLAMPRYVVDHLIPLEIGGTNDIGNLWPQPRGEAKLKDYDENRLAKLVRDQQLSMAQAQRKILELWGG